MFETIKNILFPGKKTVAVQTKTAKTSDRRSSVRTTEYKGEERRQTTGRRKTDLPVEIPPDFDINRDLPVLPGSLVDHVAWDPHYRHRLFGDIAVEKGYLSAEDIEHLVSERSKHNIPVGELAVRHKLMQQYEVDECLVLQKITVLIDERQFANPEFLTWMADCRRKVGGGIRFVRSTQGDISRLRDAIKEKTKEISEENVGLDTLNRAVELFQECAAFRGSDIHIMVRANMTEIQLRAKGELKTIDTMTKAEGESLVRAIYTGVASIKESMFNPYEYQDAQISGDNIPGAGLTSVRIIRGPCYPVEEGGQFLIARLQYGQKKPSVLVPARTKHTPVKPAGSLRLPSMGYTELQVSMLEKMTRMPSGVILVTGPTGSGKTSTLYELMMQQARVYPGSRQITVENPVEYPMNWAIQLPVVGAKTDKEAGAAYLNAVRMTLRMDPDIVLLGELRGAEEAKAAIQEAMTGHLVWSTIHVTDPYLVIDRLEQLDRTGLHRSVVCDHKLLRGMIGQRLVPVLCEHCKVRLELNDSRFTEVEMFRNILLWNKWFVSKGLKTEEHEVCVRGDGCKACGGDGIKGARAVAEVVMTTPELMRVFIDDGTDAARRFNRIQHDSDLPMLANAMVHVCNGIFDPVDVEKNIDLIDVPEKEVC